MQSNPLLGVVFHWLGGLASGSFYVPYKGVRKWSWETFWLAGGMFSWLICPWIGAFVLSKDLLAVLRETTPYTFWMTYLMGALWGMGGLTFGLTCAISACRSAWPSHSATARRSARSCRRS